MPHYKDGKPARAFDRVKAVTGHRYKSDAPAEPIYSDAVVIGITEGECCELTILVGSGKLLGNVSIVGDTQRSPVAGVLLDGYWTSCNAKDCELLPQEDR